MNKFWTGGTAAYGKALQVQYRAELHELRSQLNSAATESQRRELQQRIARLTETYRERSRAMRRSLF
jgi:hypothetical protein